MEASLGEDGIAVTSSHGIYVRCMTYDGGETAGWRADCSCGWGSDWSILFRKEHLAHDAALAHLADVGQ